MNLLKYLSNTLLVDKNEIIKFSLTSPHRYKTYLIKKRSSNKYRKIAQPSRELKFFQREIVTFIENKLPIHDCAFAYRENMGVKDNAFAHVKSNYLLKMDFTDFFPSITPDLFFSMINKIDLALSVEDTLLLQNFLFWREYRGQSLRLSIGAPSSPLISNFILYFYDERMKEICDKKNIIYTRYADDLTFSTSEKDILFDIPNIVKTEINQHTNGLIKVNASKTVFSSKGHNRHITGVTLTNNNRLSLGRERKRNLSSMVHKFKCNLLDTENILRLQGLLSFAYHIEPDFQQRMCKKYGSSCMENIKKYKAES